MTKTLKLMLAGCLATLTMMAADATGKWTAETPGRNGNTMTVTMNLKADGDKLTGTVSGRRGQSDISNGKVDGDNVMFDVVREFNGNTMTQHYSGKLDGDTIHFSIKVDGMAGAEGKGSQERTLDAHRSTT
jgi:autotransporter translocation and assembly factor TamB